MEFLILFFVFILGASFGSFWSVLIRRLRWGLSWDNFSSIIFGRSECPQCRNKLDALQLFPFLWWIFQRWKCKYCKNSIPIFYLFLEFFAGLIFVFSFLLAGFFVWGFDLVNTQFWGYFVFLAMINWILLLMIFEDLLFYHINVFLWLFVVLWAVLWQFFWFVGDYFMAFWWWIIFFLVFYGVYWFGRFYVKYRFGLDGVEWFWEWDVMVAFLVGILSFMVLNEFSVLGMIEFAFYYLIVSCLFGLIFYLWRWVFLSFKQWQSIPFLPAMIVAFWVMVLLGYDFLFFI